MTNLKSGIFYINADRFEECDWHITRLSLNFNLDDKQTYRVGERNFSVAPERYLLLNEGQSFKTSAKSRVANRMVTVAFQVGLAEKILQGTSIDDIHLLDDPFQTSTGNVQFLEKTYAMDASLHSSVTSLMQVEDSVLLDECLENLLLKIIHDQLNIRKEILTINKAKPGTRVEVYKRLHWSLEYLHENFSLDVTVDQLATVACLSSFHYKRLFSEVFNISPYQYLIKLRLEKACSLLTADVKVSDVCQQVGWKDPSSFTRLFKRKFSSTPEQFRQRKVASIP